MKRPCFVRVLPLALLPLVGTLAPPALAAQTSPAQWIPEQAVICLEMMDPSRLLEPLFTPAVQDRIAGLPAYERWQDTKQHRDLTGLVRLMEIVARTNWPGMVRSVSREGLALAVGGNHRHLLVLAGDDAALLDRLHESAKQLARSDAVNKGQPDRVQSTQYGNVTGWTFNGKEAHAIVGRRFLAASDPEVLQVAVELQSAQGRSLADRNDYQAARQTVGAEAVGLLFVDLEALRAVPRLFSGLDAWRRNPLGALLLADVPDMLQTAPWLALGIYRDGDTLCFRAFTGGEPAARAKVPFANPGSQATRLPPSLTVPRQIAGLSLLRDLAGFYATKDELFPQRTSGLIFFENMMGIFFSGRNLTDEVLAQTRPDIRLVVARQDYDPAIGTPESRLPAFAVVFSLREPDQFGEVVEEAWQKALGLVNFTRGQKALPGLILDKVDHHGTRITVSYFSAKDEPDRSRLAQRFNFRPSLALVQGHAILSSTDPLAGDLVDALSSTAAAKTGDAGAAHSQLQLRGAELAASLQANRTTLVRDHMIKEGKTQAEAETHMDTLFAVVQWLDQVTLEWGGAGQTLAKLRMTFAAP